MKKGFSGISDISEQSVLQGPEHSQQDSTSNSPSPQNEIANKDYVTYDDNKSMPGLWQSQDKDNGTSWESEDHVFVLQYRPCSQSKVMNHIINGGNPTDCNLVEQETKFRYWWILCVYYKPGKGPKAADDRWRWPILIIALAQVNLKDFESRTGKSLAGLNCDENGWGEPFLRIFLPGRQHANITESITSLLGIDKFLASPLSTSEKNRIEEIIKKLFLDLACDYVKPSTQPVKIGNMYNGFSAVYSDRLPPDVRQKVLKQNSSSGCLWLLLCFPGFVLFSIIKWIIYG